MGIVIGLLSLVLIVVCLLLGLLILVQLPKKDAGLGMAFGAGAVDTLLGAGGGNALTRITKWAAGIFLGLCIALACLYNNQGSSESRTRGVRNAISASQSTKTTPATATPGMSALVAPTNAAVIASTNIPVLSAPKPASNAPAGK